MPQRLGQHFLHDGRVLNAIVSALDLSANDDVVEVGPGRGVLTKALAEHAGTITAIELDGGLVVELRRMFAMNDKVVIIHGNVLDLDPCALPFKRTLEEGIEAPVYKLAGNIPYYVTGALLRMYLETKCKPSSAVLMVQLEVAQRMLAKPGDMNLLAVSAQLYARPSMVIRVPPRAFRPAPKVYSAVVKLEVLPQPSVATGDVEQFFTVVRAGFSTRRKQLVNALENGLPIPKPELREIVDEAALPPKARAEDLSLQDWSRLALIFQRRRPCLERPRHTTTFVGPVAGRFR